MDRGLGRGDLLRAAMTAPRPAGGRWEGHFSGDCGGGEGLQWLASLPALLGLPLLDSYQPPSHLSSCRQPPKPFILLSTLTNISMLSQLTLMLRRTEGVLEIVAEQVQLCLR